jgi:hypothetical protein
MNREDLNKLLQDAKKPAVDFHGTLNSGRFNVPDGTIIITGTPEKDKKYVTDELSRLGMANRIDKIVFNPSDNLDKKYLGEWKAKMIIKYNIDVFLDNDPKVIYYINQYLDEHWK